MDSRVGPWLHLFMVSKQSCSPPWMLSAMGKNGSGANGTFYSWQTVISLHV